VIISNEMYEHIFFNIIFSCDKGSWIGLIKKEILSDYFKFMCTYFKQYCYFCCDKGPWIGLMKKEFLRLFQIYYYYFLLRQGTVNRVNEEVISRCVFQIYSLI